MPENSKAFDLKGEKTLETGTLVNSKTNTSNKSKKEKLFNGKDFSNWKLVTQDPNLVFEDVWKISNDGTLICTGSGVSYIRTVRDDYSNYVLTLDWRWLTSGNSGVLIHATTQDSTKNWPQSVEVQLAHKNAGDLYAYGIKSFRVPDMETRKIKSRYLNLTDDSEKPAGEWNHLEVRCENDEIIVYVNGVLVNHATECSDQIGAIGLQSEKREIHFRKIELKPIE